MPTRQWPAESATKLCNIQKFFLSLPTNFQASGIKYCSMLHVLTCIRGLRRAGWSPGHVQMWDPHLTLKAI